MIAAAESGPFRCGISGSDRVMLYRLALGTGFRRGELASLTPESIELEGETPIIRILAGYSKHRREDIQPIRPDLAEQLRPWLSDRPAKGPLWPKLNRSSVIVREDLLASRCEWLKEAQENPEEVARWEASDFLAYRNHRGLVADFHALRHTFITHLVGSGAPGKAAQMLARHSPPMLTLGRYTHAGMDESVRALSGMLAVGNASEKRKEVGDPTPDSDPQKAE